MDSSRYPRKFSLGGLTGSVTRSGSGWGNGPASDNKEYWAYDAQSFPPLIDEATYLSSATAESNIPGVPVNAVRSASCAGNCGYFVVPANSTAVFNGSFSVPTNSIIYVQGSAEFDNVSFASTTFIITGNLTVASSGSGFSTNLTVPTNAAVEYPYAPTSWPCYGSSSCASSTVFTSGGNMSFHGFLYVKGNFILSASNWNMAGAMLIGDMQANSGQLQIGTGNRLNLAYDDAVNHGILVNPVSGTKIMLVPDSTQDVPLP